MKFLKAASLCTVLASALFVNAAFAATCSNVSVNGVFGVNFGGSDSSGDVTTSVGQYHFDGNGNVSGAFTGSRNGTIINVTFTGTYTVAKNCTGSMVLDRSDGVTEPLNFVIDNAKKGLQIIRTDATQIKDGFAVAQGTGTCGFTGKKQTYAFILNGKDIPSSKAEAFVGQITLDGKGTIVAGSVTLDVGGNVGSATLTGTYTVNSDCTGTQFIQPSGGLSPANFYFVLVNSGKEMLMVQTDSDEVVSGNAQQ